jgi:hypothetical protein
MQLSGLIEERLRTKTCEIPVPPFPLPLIAAQLASAQLALIADWLAGRHRCGPAVFAKALCTSSFAAAEALTAPRAPAAPAT